MCWCADGSPPAAAPAGHALRNSLPQLLRPRTGVSACLQPEPAARASGQPVPHALPHPQLRVCVPPKQPAAWPAGWLLASCCNTACLVRCRLLEDGAASSGHPGRFAMLRCQLPVRLLSLPFLRCRQGDGAAPAGHPGRLQSSWSGAGASRGPGQRHNRGGAGAAAGGHPSLRNGESVGGGSRDVARGVLCGHACQLVRAAHVHRRAMMQLWTAVRRGAHAAAVAADCGASATPAPAHHRS